MAAAPTHRIRPRRSVLYMPGANPRALDKARTLPADCLIMDLEDAVAPDAKARARELVAEALARGGYGRREVLVRVNGEGTPWLEADLQMAAHSGADGIVLPKVESAETVHKVAHLLHHAGAMKPLWAMIETPLGVLRTAAIAGAGEHLCCLLMGTSDLTKDLRLDARSAPTGLAWSLGQCVVAARAHGLDIIDGAYLDLEDDEGLRDACARARALGFDGKSLIHPRQIAPASAAFSPASADLEQASAIIHAHRQALAEGRGVTVLNGRLVEALHVAQAERLLALADAIEALEAPA